MDALIVLVIFAVLIGSLWSLGAHGLALILAGCAVVTALVEGVWVWRFGLSASQEVGRLKRWKLLAVILLVEAGAIGLGIHFWKMQP